MSATDAQTVTFTLDDVVAKVREVAAENPDYVYEPPRGVYDEEWGPSAGDCKYRHDGKPSCIVGQALDRLGYVVPVKWEGAHAGALLAHIFNTTGDDPKVQWVRLVQSNQDACRPWGEAVSRADAGLWGNE